MIGTMNESKIRRRRRMAQIAGGFLVVLGIAAGVFVIVLLTGLAPAEAIAPGHPPLPAPFIVILLLGLPGVMHGIPMIRRGAAGLAVFFVGLGLLFALTWRLRELGALVDTSSEARPAPGYARPASVDRHAP